MDTIHDGFRLWQDSLGPLYLAALLLDIGGLRSGNHVL